MNKPPKRQKTPARTVRWPARGRPRLAAAGRPAQLVGDELDRRLIALLQANARESTADLARRLGVARTTVVARMQRLERTGMIVGYTVRLQASPADGLLAHVGITVQPKAGREVERQLSRLPEVRQLLAVSGQVDYIALLQAQSPAHLNQLLDEVGEIDGVTKTLSSIVLASKLDRRA
jgi:DNA-binding Lrp family transcriptional regulator